MFYIFYYCFILKTILFIIIVILTFPLFLIAFPLFLVFVLIQNNKNVPYTPFLYNVCYYTENISFSFQFMVSIYYIFIVSILFLRHNFVLVVNKYHNTFCYSVYFSFYRLNRIIASKYHQYGACHMFYTLLLFPLLLFWLFMLLFFIFILSCVFYCFSLIIITKYYKYCFYNVCYTFLLLLFLLLLLFMLIFLIFSLFNKYFISLHLFYFGFNCFGVIILTEYYQYCSYYVCYNLLLFLFLLFTLFMLLFLIFNLFYKYFISLHIFYFDFYCFLICNICQNMIFYEQTHSLFFLFHVYLIYTLFLFKICLFVFKIFYFYYSACYVVTVPIFDIYFSFTSGLFYIICTQYIYLLIFYIIFDCFLFFILFLF